MDARMPTGYWSLAAIGGSFLLVHQAPQYLLVNSYFFTAIQLFLLELLSWVVWRVILYPKYLSPLRHLPHPKDDSLFMGQYKRIAGEPTGSPQRDWIANIPNDGLIYYRGLFNMERVLLTHPKALAEVLTTRNYEFIKPSFVRAGLVRVLGDGILLTEGEEHKFQRKNLMPAFSYRHIKDLIPVFWAKTQELLEAMTKTVQENPEAGKEKNSTAVLEISNWVSRATLDIIGVSGMGRDFGAIADPDNELSQTYQRIFSPPTSARLLLLLQIVLPLWLIRLLPLKRNNDINAAVSVIRRTCSDLLAQKKIKLASAEQEKAGPSSSDLADNAAGVDILSVAMQSGAFSEENLVDQLMTFLAAGHETTASALIWATMLLCQHPEVQTRLRAEVREHMPSPSNSGPLSPSIVDEMPYLHAVCNETLRFYPSVPFTTRVAAHDTTIIDHHIPKGTRVILCPWAVNHSPALWGSDAGVFNPDRWMGPGRANTGGAESNYAFMTFLHGPRSCIGSGFARAEFAVLLAGLVGRFEMRLKDPDRKLEIKGGITAKPLGGLEVICKIVDGW